MSVFQKVLFSFLFSAFLFAVIVVFLFTADMANEPEGILIFTSVFLTLFLIVFFCFNVHQDSADVESVPATQPMDIESVAVAQPIDIGSVTAAELIDYESEATAQPETLQSVPEIENNVPQAESADEELEELEELEAADIEFAEEETTASTPAKAPNVKIAFDDDDVPYLIESSGLELVDGDLNEIARFIEYENTDDEIEDKPADVDVEVVSPFASMLPLLEDAPSNDAVPVSSLEDAPPIEDVPSIDDGEIAELEDISTCAFSIFREPGVHAFTFSSGNPEMLQNAEDAEGTHTANQVIYEQNGIHYINRNLDGDVDMDIDFAKLVNDVISG